jgi:predicted nicotinamide N-methyase
MHIPILDLRGREYYPWQILSFVKHLIKKNPFHLKTWNNDLATFVFQKKEIKLLPYYANIVWREGIDWESEYLPRSVRGKRVLDVGAGCGETALFYLSYGAKKVIAIEPDPDACVLLRHNLADLIDSGLVECRQKLFELDDLSNIDFVKMDGEGCEEELLKLNSLPKIIMETHGKVLSEKLTAKFDLRKLRHISREHSLLTNL